MSAEFVNATNPQSTMGSDDDLEQSLKDQLISLVHGLLRVNRLKDCLLMYGEAMKKQSKATVRDVVKNCLSILSVEKGVTVSEGDFIYQLINQPINQLTNHIISYHLTSYHIRFK